MTATDPPPWPQASWPQAPPEGWSAPEGAPRDGRPDGPAPPAPAPGPFGIPPWVRWGMGDVFYGLLVWVGGSFVAAIALFLTGAIDTTTGDVGELGLGMVALLVASGWVGLGGWPLVASYRKGQRSLSADFGLTIRWIDVAWGVGAGVVALALSIGANLLWSALSGSEPPSNADFIPTSLGVAGGVLLFVLVAVCTPVVEELFFRGLFLRSVARKWGVPAGAAVSSLVFGLLHAQGSGIVGAAFIVFVTASYGLLFALVDIRNGGRLGPSIVAHTVVNGVGVAVALLTGS